MNTLLHKQSICNVRNLALMLMCSLMALTSYSQEGSWGNTYIGNSGAATFFGAHNFVTGGSGSQPGLIKTERTAPLGILYYGPDATYTGADNANHVDGYVAKHGTSSFIFPIGNGTKLRTAGISAPSSSATFKAAYWFENPNSATLPAGAPFPVANLGTGVTGVSNVEYWDVDGPSAIDLTLTWDAASNLNTLSGGDLNNLIIVGYNSTTNLWESLGGTATGTLTGTGSVVATGVTPDNYAAFTFGSQEALTTPDLRPYLIMANTSFTPAATSRAFSVRIRNMRTNTIATETVTLRVYKPTPTSTIILTGASLTEWTIVNSGLYYTLTTNLDVNANSPLGITLNAQISIPAATASGNYPLRAFIPNLSGGEVLGDNVNNNIEIKIAKSN